LHHLSKALGDLLWTGDSTANHNRKRPGIQSGTRLLWCMDPSFRNHRYGQVPHCKASDQVQIWSI
jgi:hypothetical protein